MSRAGVYCFSVSVQGDVSSRAVQEEFKKLREVPSLVDTHPEDSKSGSISGPVLSAEQIYALERPDKRLWQYWILCCMLFGPLFPIALLYAFFRFRTLRYRFDDEGVSMSWGALWHREINLAYARIQDIHLTSNLVERWLGLARIQIQTASGSSKPEMTIAGIAEFEELRRYLVRRMRSTRHGEDSATALRAESKVELGAEPVAQLTEQLAVVATELRALRLALEGEAIEATDSAGEATEPQRRTTAAGPGEEPPREVL